METTENISQDQTVRGACPATGRSASVCADQSHTECWAGRPVSDALDRKVEAEYRRLDGTY